MSTRRSAPPWARGLDHIADLRRINVIGTSGSGKSHFSRQLAEVLAIPCYEMDAVFWKPDWQESADEEFVPKISEITSRDAWILDGNYTRTTPEKWRSVQLVIWLDLSFPRTVLRVTKRAILRGWGQHELWPGTGNRESLAKAFLSRDSIILWAITTYRRNRRKYSGALRSPEWAHIEFIRLRSPREVTAFLADVRRTVERSDPEPG